MYIGCRILLKEQDDERNAAKERNDQLFGKKRQIILRDYSLAVRVELHERRAREKQERLDEEEAKCGTIV